MPKQSRKRQRTVTGASEATKPLGSTHSDDGSEDDEERRLESLLFGTAYTVRDEDDAYDAYEPPYQDDRTGDKVFQNLMDTDLFFVDDTVGEGSSEVGEELLNEAHTLIRGGTRESHLDSKTSPWDDSDDTTLNLSLVTNQRLRKLRDALSEDAVGGKEYERRLRRQFEKVNPTPDWVMNARKNAPGQTAKRRRSSDSLESVSDEEELSELLSATNGVVSRSHKGKVLSPGTLTIQRLRDANITAKSDGELKAVKFHPSRRVPVLLTASSDRRLRLFNVDGHTNPHLQTIHIPSLPLTTAHFHPSGTSILLTGPRPFYYVYDLQSGDMHRSPRGLWGTTFSSANPASQDASMEVCSFNPSGEILAVAGRRGYVHLVDWRSGQGQVVGNVKMNAAVKSLWWSRGDLMTLGEDAQVYVWNVGERRCIRRWRDDGGFGSRILSGDRAGQYVAIGSHTGLVNVYDSSRVLSSDTQRAKPLKSIGNLTTSITSLCFNHDSQLLAIASNTKKDQMRMIHLSSMTTFSNWPTSGTPIGHVTSVDFSSGSEYVAVGNNRGRVLLYHLSDFSPQ
ncbi:WD40-repeat-containing domain protein [Sparassis latifolia]